uniref:Cysteine/serine-rich nuclear protein N-terminal domain-containing protein n=1 Tax=Mola mola TaxID=94237 RepID=A0A3Q3VVZ6_MOLML
MSGILKRKLEEGPTPYESLQGSEDDDVSCSDSGNSSDSLNHAVPSGLLDCKSKRMRGRNVHFESVTVYYFNRRQGFTSVPTQGGSTLGMSPRHSWVKRFTLREFAMEQKQSHWNMLRDHLKEEKLNAIKLKLTKNGTVSSVEADSLTLDDISEDDLDVDNTEVDDYFFLQPLTTRRRRALLRSSGVRRIDVEEKHELRALRVSREECGCRCRGICDPETCACSLAGIKCQVDRMSFPCGCTKEGCSNATGRLEFNPIRVRTHFLHTIMKLELERKEDEAYEEDEDGSSVCSGLSDCSTHSLETIDPEEGEEDEEDEEEEDDEDEEEEEDEDDWDCSLHGAGPPPYSAPLPSMLSYSHGALMGLSGPSMQHYQTGRSASLPTVESALESTMNTEAHCQTELPSIPSPTEPPARQTRSHADTREQNTSPAGGAGEQQLLKDLQNSGEHHDSQTGGSARQTGEGGTASLQGDQTPSASRSDSSR